MSEALRSEFDALYLRSRGDAMARALRLTRNRDDAADLVQSTYLQAWMYFASYRREMLFERWLMRIMRNQFLDDLRMKARRIQAVSYDALPSDGLEPTFFADDQFEREVFSKFPGEACAYALDSMEERDRDLMCELFVDGDSYRIIAERRGVTRQRMAKRAERALEKAREAVSVR